MGSSAAEVVDLVSDDEVQVLDERVPKRKRVEQQDAIPPLIPAQNTSENNMNKVLKSLHSERMQRVAGKATRVASKPKQQVLPLKRFSVLSYNIWFDPVCFNQRMAAIIDIIKEENLPDVIMLQEVTHQSYQIFSSQAVLKKNYRISQASRNMPYFTVLMCRVDTVAKNGKPFQIIPFQNSHMGRDVKFMDCEVCNEKFRFATSHLESPIPGNQYTTARQQQFTQAIQNLDQPGIVVVYGGDMNWDDKRDGEMKIPEHWQDSWTATHPGNPGPTYDGVNNGMLSNRMKSRLDRIVFKLPKFKVKEAKLVGNKEIKGLTYEKQRKGGKITLPVYPSDHFGLLVEFERMS
eukprot:TRINITY_DN2527_c0_g1_i5.p1 TRINITY_DN2527_c0_g1~~TRINITY_DN2527_c0_g1_i5.p1  ORF type:complete len:348 (-),score=44.25 TRINITY_DN2527_c0_g1_i5:343-1386(-)